MVRVIPSNFRNISKKKNCHWRISYVTRFLFEGYYISHIFSSFTYKQDRGKSYNILLKRLQASVALWVDFHWRVFRLRTLTHVNFNHVNNHRRKIKSAELKREVKRGSTVTLTSDLSCIASILFTNLNFTHIRKKKLRRDTGNQSYLSSHERSTTFWEMKRLSVIYICLKHNSLLIISLLQI